MATIGIKELRDTLARTIRRVEEGERIEVTRDGKRVAVIAPLSEDPLTRLLATGRARPPRHPFRVPDPASLPRLKGRRTASEVLLDGRDERE